MSKEHAYAYEAGYRDGSINYELEHCPACKNVADLQEALAENAKLRELVEDMHAALQAFCDAQDVHGDNCPLWVERTDDCELRGIERRMRELEVDACPNCGRKVVEPTTNDVDAEVDA